MRKLWKTALMERAFPHFFLGLPKRPLRRLRKSHSRRLSRSRARDLSAFRHQRQVLGRPSGRAFGRRCRNVAHRVPSRRGFRNGNVRVLRHPVPGNPGRGARSGNHRGLSASRLPAGMKLDIPALRARIVERRPFAARRERASLSRGDLYVLLPAIPHPSRNPLRKKPPVPRCFRSSRVLRPPSFRGSERRAVPPFLKNIRAPRAGKRAGSASRLDRTLRFAHRRVHGIRRVSENGRCRGIPRLHCLKRGGRIRSRRKERAERRHRLLTVPRRLTLPLALLLYPDHARGFGYLSEINGLRIRHPKPLPTFFITVKAGFFETAKTDGIL